jgi:hypothetical protein
MRVHRYSLRRRQSARPASRSSHVSEAAQTRIAAAVSRAVTAVAVTAPCSSEKKLQQQSVGWRSSSLAQPERNACARRSVPHRSVASVEAVWTMTWNRFILE